MNPRNCITLNGYIDQKGIQVLRAKDGTEYAIAFTLLVKRNFRGKDGKYAEDPVPVKYPLDKGTGSFARSLVAGDGLLICGTLRIEKCVKSCIQYVLAESMTLDEGSRSQKFNRNGELVNAAFPVQGKPLPL